MSQFETDRIYGHLKRKYGASAGTTYTYLRRKYQVSAIDALFQMKQQLSKVGRDPGFLASLETVTQYRNPARFPSRRPAK